MSVASLNTEATATAEFFRLTQLNSYGQEWMEPVERALGALVGSVTAKRFHPSVLTNTQYRVLGKQANVDSHARAVFYQYYPELNADPRGLKASRTRTSHRH